ncbi:MAG TPA: RluA family pseudouridine synthase [Planctomycetota bacterium]|nr:RluA family pseudouridine synthase [Planctomycetota bacterium]
MADTIELTVDDRYQDIVEFLAAALPSLPLSRLRRLVAHGHAAVEGRRVDHRFVPQPGQAVVLTLPETPIVRYEPRKLDFEVLHEDPHLLAIDKPAGVGVIPAPGTLEATLINGLLWHIQRESPSPCQRIHIVHRLDKDTTGVLLVAKDLPTARHLSACFEQRRVSKHYLALVRGEMAAGEGEVDLPIAPSATRGKMRVRRGEGRPARSRFRVLECFRGYTLVEVRPLTGRQHQVRLHLAGLGHPLAVDPLYGGAAALYLSEIKPGYRRKEGRPEAPLMPRLTLHARRVELELADGSPLAVEAPLPADFDRLLRSLRKYRTRR